MDYLAEDKHMDVIKQKKKSLKCGESLPNDPFRHDNMKELPASG
jgi:hypothetical protein